MARSTLFIARGELHGQARLTDANVREIRERYKQRRSTRITMKRLALAYGVSAQQIKRILHGQAWKHLL